MITVGLTLATVEIASAPLASKNATWTATFDLARAAATVDLTDGTPAHGLRLTVFVSATSQLTIVTAENTGASPLPFNTTPTSAPTAPASHKATIFTLCASLSFSIV